MNWLARSSGGKDVVLRAGNTLSSRKPNVILSMHERFISFVKPNLNIKSYCASLRSVVTSYVLVTSAALIFSFLILQNVF